MEGTAALQIYQLELLRTRIVRVSIELDTARAYPQIVKNHGKLTNRKKTADHFPCHIRIMKLG